MSRAAIDTATQAAAWRELWDRLLAPPKSGQEDAAGDQPAASDAEVSRASGDHASS